MHVVQKQQLQLGELAIADIDIDLKSRDDIPKFMLVLQYLYTEKKEELFEILEKYFCPHRNHAVGRPGMDIWRILVPDILKQGLDCDFDRIQLFANRLPEVCVILGHTGFADTTYYELETIIGNMNLLSEELLGKVNQLIIEGGHKLVKKNPDEPLRGRCDSFVVETVH